MIVSRPTPSPLRRARLLLAGLVLVSADALHAQNLFVCLAGKTKSGSVITIPAPGYGWNYSALAPVLGDHWNRVPRTAGVDATDPSVAGAPGTAKLGVFPLDTAAGVTLVDPAGQPTGVRLSIEIEIAALAIDRQRSEPTIYSKSQGALPPLLMGNSWRVIVTQNAMRFTLAGLAPGKAYDFYFYGAAVDPLTNPMGDNEGARFTLSPENIAPGDSGTVETVGGFGGGIFTYTPETERMTPSPSGTTWATMPVVADGRGQIAFRTSANSKRRHFVNGFQLVEKKS